MGKATFVDATYHNSDNIEVTGDRDSIKRNYLDKGYSIKKSRNGVYVLRKPTHILVFLEDSDGKSYEFNMTSSILRYYGIKGLNYPFFLNFVDDAASGKISFYIKNGNCSLQ